MADLPTLTLIVINPDLSGRALKAMVLARAPDGTFSTHPDFPDVALGDGQTTMIRIPLGARIVISEASEPPMAATMAGHPAVTGQPVQPGDSSGPLTAQEERRRDVLAAQSVRNQAEDAELAALQTRFVPTTAGWPPGPVPAATPSLSADEEARRRAGQSVPPAPATFTSVEETRRAALQANTNRNPTEDAELAALQARQAPGGQPVTDAASRRAVLQSNTNRNSTENAELADLDRRLTGNSPSPYQATPSGGMAQPARLSADEEARRVALSQSSRNPDEDAELARLNARR